MGQNGLERFGPICATARLRLLLKVSDNDMKRTIRSLQPVWTEVALSYIMMCSSSKKRFGGRRVVQWIAWVPHVQRLSPAELHRIVGFPHLQNPTLTPGFYDLLLLQPHTKQTATCFLCLWRCGDLISWTFLDWREERQETDWERKEKEDHGREMQTPECRRFQRGQAKVTATA